ncbi:putative membrane protein involved in D-alanine export [Burkholderiales bacterium JOSHI_001]|nr:putative membrane protein involved in D-alanine export [Burkholderiales bacterium JOSHI_001]
MLFNSYEFLFGFLPLVLGGFLFLSRFGLQRPAAAWLGLASVVFYAWWSPRYVLLLLGSIALNYLFGQAIARRARDRQARTGRLLTVAVTANLALLAYYKYANFFIDTARALSGAALPGLDVVLPIGISFFTFTQIAFLVDCSEAKVQESDPVHYLLFVTYFPHLIAGPVLHHAEMMPQFARKDTYRWDLHNVFVGAAFFGIGLFKKVVLADGIQPWVGPVFDGGPAPDALSAWGAALAYTLQLYFDFSAYSDMAVGLSKLFNVDLPLNFDSPYKARNISDFWRRWHMTLSRFLRDYLYIRLGGNRHGPTRRHVNLMTTMLLGGLWHGAGWTFVIWGGLHGLYLVVNHAWSAWRSTAGDGDAGPMERVVSHTLTLLAVVVAWVFFRAHTVEDALRVLGGMSGLAGWAPSGGADARQWLWIGVLGAVALACPNSQQIVARWLQARDDSATPPALAARPGVQWMGLGALLMGCLLLAIVNGSRGVSEFIYFNF